jgi:hypothetical protein
MQVPAFVDPLLDVRQQVGCVLNLIEDDRRRVHFQEAPRIGGRRRPNVGRFQRNVTGTLAKNVLE